METHIPLRCDICGAPTELVHNIEIYGHPVGDWEWHIRCTDPNCGAHVETNPGTGVARAGMATPETRQARIMAHNTFDRLWKTKYQRRNAYEWLARMMNLSRKDCHIGRFSYEQCHEVVRLVLLHKPVIADLDPNDQKYERFHHRDRRREESTG